ncbi:HlyD family efflux transporter periplasmic adaptor subunit [Romboutsia sp. 13368]|uniref:HlyD family efflux transporter periplasmic adaptor subunit n=1 Tax=Romboutsia sp. 13368 TaxID=2708053 RepID=UPI0025D1371B|nr:HlyD family efflux transporter periplasmic adaptor subunit [Romboutsia sp. 13368]
MKKIKNIKHSNLLILIIFTYILFGFIINLIGKCTDTLVIETEKVELKVTTKGLIIRDEYLVKSNQSGTINFTARNGEKLKKGDTIGVIYNNIKNLDENKSTINKLNEEIETLKIDKENSKSNFSKELIDVKINTKIEQRKKLTNENNKNLNSINIPTSGVVSNNYDGYEDIYTIENMENITAKDIENTENNYKDINIQNEYIKESEIIARIISSNYSYIAISIDKDIFEEKQSVEIVLDKKNIEGYVEKIYENEGNNVIIFKISNQNVEIYDTRATEFDIIYKQIEGLKIPKQSVEELNDKKGVYVLNQQTKKVDFIELKNILYEDDDFIFIDYYKNQKEGIKTVDIYDEIIVKPNILNKNIKISR